MFKKLFIISLLTLWAGACRATPASPTPTLAALVTGQVLPSTTALLPTSMPSAMPTAEPSATVMPTATDTPVPTDTPSPTETPWPTMIPPLDPATIGDVLLGAFAPQVMTITNGHKLTKIGEWEYGFGGFCGRFYWADDMHLMVYPITGETGDYNDFGVYQHSVPVIINVATSHTWQPVMGNSPHDCQRVIWVRPYAKLLVLHDGATELLDWEGRRLKQFSGGGGEGLISPSQRWLFTGSILIDLQTNRLAKTGLGLPGDWFGIPAWSADETKLFRCCFGYLNLKTGAAADFDPGLEQAGRGCAEGGCIASSWLPNGKWVVANWDFDGAGGTIYNPIFDTETQTWVRPLPPEAPPACLDRARASASGIYAVTPCDAVVYQLNLQTGVIITRPNDGFKAVQWAPDEQSFLLGREFDYYAQATEYVWQSVSQTTGIPLGNQPSRILAWQDHWLLALAQNAHTLFFLDTQHSTLQLLELTKPARPNLLWANDRQSAVLVSEDNFTLYHLTPATAQLTPFTLTHPISPTVYWVTQNRYVTFLGQDEQSLVTLDLVENTLQETELFQTVAMPLPSLADRPVLLFTSANRQALLRFDSATGTLATFPLTDPMGAAHFWDAPNARLFWLTPSGNVLGGMEIDSGEMISTSLPTNMQTLLPHPTQGLALLATDGSFWWLPDLSALAVTQLTLPLPEVHDMQWSATGARLAFLSGKTFYVVDVLDR